jgi:ABC-type Fe3+-siderophore transport system permease subunit
MPRTLVLILGVICVFAVVALIMVKIMPGPLKDSDYLVIGSVATLVALLALFFGLVSTSMKASDVFFKRRKKPR